MDDPNQVYSKFAPIYANMIQRMPNWQAWLQSVLPHVTGPKVLDVSCGTGYLSHLLLGKYNLFAIEMNDEMIHVARKTLREYPEVYQLNQADAVNLPFREGCFNTVINTMSIRSYQDPEKALHEMGRVLKPGEKLLIVDISSPVDGNKMGKALSRLWQNSPGYGVDIQNTLLECGFDVKVKGIGGFGSVQLTIAKKQSSCFA